MPKSRNIKNQSNDEYTFSTVVYVTDQYTCENLIAKGREIADETETNLYVVNVSNIDSVKRPIDLNALEYLYQISRKHQAVMNIFYETDILGVLNKTAKEYDALNVVIGAPRQESSVLESFLRMNRQCTFHMVYTSGTCVQTTEENVMLSENDLTEAPGKKVHYV